MSQHLSNKQLISVANEFGTPVYVYHAERIAEQYNKLKTAFAKCDAKFFFACKSLTNINILKWMKEIGASLDCVSINEVMLGLKAGFKPSNILYTPNCVDFEEIEAAKDLGVNINIDNISTLEQFGNKFGSSHSNPLFFLYHLIAAQHK